MMADIGGDFLDDTLYLLGAFAVGFLFASLGDMLNNRQMAKEREVWAAERSRLLDRLQSPQFVMGAMPDVPPVEQITDEYEYQFEQTGKPVPVVHDAWTPEEFLEQERTKQGFEGDE